MEDKISSIEKSLNWLFLIAVFATISWRCDRCDDKTVFSKCDAAHVGDQWVSSHPRQILECRKIHHSNGDQYHFVQFSEEKK